MGLRRGIRSEARGLLLQRRNTEILVEYREQDIAFRPASSAATSSRHVPVTKQDIAEHLPDDRLARLLEENPDVGEIVLRAKEERARAIAAWEAAEKAEREREDRRETKRDGGTWWERALERLGPRVTTVAEAAVVRRPDYTSETYVPLYHICLCHQVFQHTCHSD
ncbi:hypothetical protein RHMOL_Rhmol08G0169200 [Rhododendron molle]|uniref:Uncharacterized protein n=1 Tax=Rhododendron molle TaxID=49168 RepID=A0ACC0MP48_RHOML|nr:hypothetical protein RHMOL_Rhmol08G0169200 [Rhododendron molle]